MEAMTQLEARYRIRAPLRCEGVGTLDCAEDVESGMRMAIRWLPVDANGEAAAKAVEQMPVHPVLPRIRATGVVGASAYVAMEFPEGRLLSTMVDEPLDAQGVVQLAAAIADALALLHAQNVVHGSFSADSVLVLPEGKAILWDVPLVTANRLTDRRSEERELAQLVRCAPYLSPERARGLPGSAPSDVYALGALISLASGGQPPPGGTTLAVVHQIANGQWTPELPRALHPLVREVVEKMISSDPLARPSAAQVATVLHARLQQTPTIPEIPKVLEPVAYPVLSPPPLPVKTHHVEPAQSVVLEPELEAATKALKQATRRRAMVAMLAVAVLAVGTAVVVRTGLTLSAPVQVAQLQPPVAPAPVAPAAVEAQLVVPAEPEPEPSVAELVEPLVAPPGAIAQAHRPKQKRVRKARVEAVSAAPAEAEPVKAEPVSAPEVIAAPAASTSELKRPSF